MRLPLLHRTPPHGWRAPAWTGASGVPTLYSDHDDLLFLCAMIDEAQGALELQPLRQARRGEVEEREGRGAVLRRAEAWRRRASEFLALQRTAVEATQASQETAAEIAERGGELLLRCLQGEAEVEASRHFWLACEGPTEQLAWLEQALHEQRGAAVRAELRSLRERLRIHDEALGAARQTRGELARQARRRQRLLDDGDQVLRALHRLAPPHPRLVPRAAPDEAESSPQAQGHFELPFSALERCHYLVRVLGDADTFLALGRLPAPASGEGPGEQHRLLAFIRHGRRRLVQGLEVVARQASLYETQRARRAAATTLLELCTDAMVRYDLDRDALRDSAGDRLGLAAAIAAQLVGDERAFARETAQQLTLAIAASPEADSASPDELYALMRPAEELYRVAIDLEVALAAVEAGEEEE